MHIYLIYNDVEGKKIVHRGLRDHSVLYTCGDADRRFLTEHNSGLKAEPSLSKHSNETMDLQLSL